MGFPAGAQGGGQVAVARPVDLLDPPAEPGQGFGAVGGRQFPPGRGRVGLVPAGAGVVGGELGDQAGELGELPGQRGDLLTVVGELLQREPESPRAGEADLIVAKNRNGPTLTTTVAYQYHYCRFIDMAPNEHEYPIFPAKPHEPENQASASSDVQQVSIHDRQLYRTFLEQLSHNGSIIDWLKNNFMLKAFPLRHVETLSHVATMSLEVIGFDDKEANDRYSALREAIDNFCEKVSYYTYTDPGNNWLEVPNEWRDRDDRTQYNTAMAAITDVRKEFVEAYDSFLLTCHKKGIDSDGPAN